MSFFKKLFGKKEEKAPEPEFTEKQHEQAYELKKEGLESVLGEMHDIVGHAIIPFSVGGAVDMYYFNNHIDGTGFATMELLDPNGNGPLKNKIGTYELIAFTNKKYEASEDEKHPFNLIERKACSFLTAIGAYSSQAVINPKETIEVPNGDGKENTCLVLDLYEPDGRKFTIGDSKHHLLLCMQLFRSEMDYARENGSDELFKILKEKGVYPYSDLDREAVV